MIWILAVLGLHVLLALPYTLLWERARQRQEAPGLKFETERYTSRRGRKFTQTGWH